MGINLEHLPIRLRKLRENAKMSQGEAAKLAGITQGQISNYEVGRAFPGLEVVMKLATVYGTTVADLLGESPPKVAPPRLPTRDEMALWVIESIGIDGFKLDQLRRILAKPT